MLKTEYMKVVSDITKSKTPYEILNNYDNLVWILEKEKYQKNKSELKNEKDIKK